MYCEVKAYDCKQFRAVYRFHSVYMVCLCTIFVLLCYVPILVGYKIEHVKKMKKGLLRLQFLIENLQLTLSVLFVTLHKQTCYS